MFLKEPGHLPYIEAAGLDFGANTRRILGPLERSASQRFGSSFGVAMNRGLAVSE